jgi:site-specific recombinase XerD
MATHMLDSGEDIITVADHLGHKNIQNTMLYAKIRNLRRDEAVRRLERSRDIVRVG